MDIKMGTVDTGDCKTGERGRGERVEKLPIGKGKYNSVRGKYLPH